jgi:hypothetical protein
LIMERSPNSSSEDGSGSESSLAKGRRIAEALKARSIGAERAAARLKDVDIRERVLAMADVVVGAEVTKSKKKKKKKKFPAAEPDMSVPLGTEADRAIAAQAAAEQDDDPEGQAESKADSKAASSTNSEERHLRDSSFYEGVLIIPRGEASKLVPEDEEAGAAEVQTDEATAAPGAEAEPGHESSEDLGESQPGYVVAEATADTPPPPASGGGNIPPPSPPERPVFATGEPQEPVSPFAQPSLRRMGMPPDLAQVYDQQNQGQGVGVQQLSPAEQMVTKQELKEAEYYAEKRGLSKGVATGVALAIYEHFKHSGRENVLRQETKVSKKKLNDTNKRYSFERQEQTDRQVRMEAQFKTEQRQAQAAESRFQTAEQRFQTAEQRYLTAERQLEAERRIQAERASNTPQEAGPEEQLAVAPEHTVQTSAWHSIEVDARTGKAVENPAFQYGREYYHERAQENVPVDQRGAAAGEVAVIAATNAQIVAPGSASLPPVIPNASMQGPPSSVQPTATKRAMPPSGGPRQPAPAPIWPWLVALAVIVVCLIIALG